MTPHNTVREDILMTKHRLAIATLLALAFTVPSALADPDAKRATLARLLHEIALLEPLIASSEAFITRWR
jgi:hypothetical protein